MEIYDGNSIAAEQYAGVNDRRSELEKLGAGAMNNRRALKDIRNLMGAPPISRAVSKRGLQDENALVDQKNANVSRRPITRKFAATLKSQAASSQGPRKTVPPPASAGTSIAIYEDPCESEESSGLPMLDEETKQLIQPPVDEELEEIDMEDIAADRLVVDIDVGDAENPLAVFDYVHEIYSFYRESEGSSCVSPNYMSIQVDINEKMRAILIDWLIEVHHKFDMLDETLFLMVNIIDRFLAKQSVARKKLQLVGVTAMLLACKYEEVSVPIVEDLVIICDRAYTKSDILEMERLMVNTLQFNMSVPTSYVFMRRFLKAAESDKELEIQSFYIIELSMVEYEMLKFPPSLLAAAAIYTAQCSLRRFSTWTRTAELHTGYSEDQLMECSKKMVDFHQKAGTGKLTGVHRKYNSFKFGYASKSEPALFLLDRKP